MTRSSAHELARIDAIFVQSAAACTSGDGAITLHGLTASVVYFADRPRREVGHISTARFVELWDDEHESFAAEPPTAVLSFVADDDTTPPDVVLVLREPRLDGGDLTYKIEVVDGTLPAESGPCALFIDSLRSPLEPVSFPGRTGRRAARRRSEG